MRLGGVAGLSLACLKPKDVGYAAELWTRSALAQHVRTMPCKTGHPALAKAAKATIQRILAKQELHPERIRYYLERRDPRFDEKMKNILLVYKAVARQNEGGGSGANPLAEMARTFLKHIRVNSWEELRDRILMSIAQIYAAPLVHRLGEIRGPR